MFHRRITLFVGDVASGKTTLAVQLAREFAYEGNEVCLLDLEIARPFELAEWLGTEPQSSPLSVVSLQADLSAPRDPIVAASLIAAALQDPCRRVVVDVSSGSATTCSLPLVLQAIPEALIDRILVLNFCRPLTSTVDNAESFARSLEAAMGLSLTGLVCNTQLLDETTVEIATAGYAKAQELAERLSVPLRAVAAQDPIASALRADDFACPILRLGRPRSQPPSRKTTTASRTPRKLGKEEASCRRS